MKSSTPHKWEWEDVVLRIYTYTEIDEPVDAEGAEENPDEATVEDYQEALGEFGVEL